jgi:hypothetical protein
VQRGIFIFHLGTLDLHGEVEEVSILIPMQEMRLITILNHIDRRWTDKTPCEPRKPKSKSRRARKETTMNDDRGRYGM